MSPLWRDEVGIHLSPTLVVVTRVKRGFRPTLVVHEELPVDGNLREFDAALRVLDRVLEDVRWRGANARVVVADGWVRYVIVPWADRLSDSERCTHAWHVLEQAFGEPMQEGWRLALSDSSAGASRLACAIPARLHGSIMEACRKATLEVRSLQPQLVAAFNCASADIDSSTGWFVSVATGTLSAAQFGPRGWNQVRALRIGSDWSAELQRLRRFGRMTALSAEDSRVFVDAPAWLQHMAHSNMDCLEIIAAPDNPHAVGTLRSLLSLRSLHP